MITNGPLSSNASKLRFFPTWLLSVKLLSFSDTLGALSIIPDNVKSGLKIIPVGMVDEVLSAALTREPLPIAIAAADSDVASPITPADDSAPSDDFVAH